MIALLASVLIAAPALRAQQPPPEPSLPERVIEGIGSAIRDIFHGIFGEREAEIPPPQQQPPPQQSPQPQASQPPQLPPEPRTEQAKPAAAPEPVAATPRAQAAPQSLHAANAKGDYASALKMIEQGADIEAKDRAPAPPRSITR